MNQMSDITANDTISIKLMSGEEIVARFLEHDAEYIAVQRPMAIVNLPSGVGLGPFMFTVPQHGEYKIVKNNVVTWAKTEVNMAKKYGEGTTGLKLS